MFSHYRKIVVFVCVLAAASVVASDAAFALRVSIQRIVFEGNTRSQIVNVINDSEEDQTYRIGWQNYRMTEDKMLEVIKGDSPEDLEGINVAAPYLRYAPRRITIPAGHSQQVRVMARVPSDLPDGEYRSHMHIAPEPKTPELTAEEIERSQERPVVKITTLMGISFPVIIRKGKLSSDAHFENGQLTHGAEEMSLAVDLVKEGSRGLFGDLDFVCVSDGKEIVAKQIIGLPVYAEVPRRKLRFNIKYPEAGATACKTVRIVYRAQQDDTQYEGKEITRTDVSL